MGEWGLAVDATHVYWTTGTPNGAVFRVPRMGGAVESIATSQPHARGLAVDATHAYCAADALVRRVPKGGGSTLDLAKNIGKATRVAVDATYVYWADSNAARSRAPK